jgi:hypothetical protein
MGLWMRHQGRVRGLEGLGWNIEEQAMTCASADQGPALRKEQASIQHVHHYEDEPHHLTSLALHSIFHPLHLSTSRTLRSLSAASEAHRHGVTCGQCARLAQLADFEPAAVCRAIPERGFVQGRHRIPEQWHITTSTARQAKGFTRPQRRRGSA